LESVAGFRGMRSMALFLSFQCHIREISFATVDVNLDQFKCRRQCEELGARVFAIDLLSASGPAALRQVIEPMNQPLALFCDNGNKRQEWVNFLPLLAEDDFIAVHDWGHEFMQEDVIGQVEGVLIRECEAVCSFTRFFRVGDPAPLAAPTSTF